MSLRGGFAEAVPCFTRYFHSNGDCRAAKEQGRRLAMTSIYEMYGSEVKIKLTCATRAGDGASSK